MNPYLRAAQRYPALRTMAIERLNARRNPTPPRPERPAPNEDPPAPVTPQVLRPRR